MAKTRTYVGISKKTGENVFLNRAGSFSFYTTASGARVMPSQIVTKEQSEHIFGTDFVGPVKMLISHQSVGRNMIAEPLHYFGDGYPDTGRQASESLRARFDSSGIDIEIWDHDYGSLRYPSGGALVGTIMNASGDIVDYYGCQYRNQAQEPNYDASTVSLKYLVGNALTQTPVNALATGWRNFVSGMDTQTYGNPNWDIVVIKPGYRDVHITSTAELNDYTTFMTAVSTWWQAYRPGVILMIITAPPLRFPAEYSDTAGWANNTTGRANALAETARYKAFCTWLSESWTALNPVQNKVLDLFSTVSWGADASDSSLHETWAQTNFLNENYAATDHHMNTAGSDVFQTAFVNAIGDMLNKRARISAVVGDRWTAGAELTVFGANFDSTDMFFVGNSNVEAEITIREYQEISDITSSVAHIINTPGELGALNGSWLYVEDGDGITSPPYLLATKRNIKLPLDATDLQRL